MLDVCACACACGIIGWRERIAGGDGRSGYDTKHYEIHADSLQKDRESEDSTRIQELQIYKFQSDGRNGRQVGYL